MKPIVISSSDVEQLKIIFKDAAEIVQLLVVQKFIPTYQTLDVKYELYYQHMLMYKTGSVCAHYTCFFDCLFVLSPEDPLL